MFEDSTLLTYAYLWQDSPFWYWFAGGLMLLGLEVISGGTLFAFFPLGIGAILVGVVVIFHPGLSLESAVIVMGIAAVILAVGIQWYLPRRAAAMRVNRTTDELLGQAAILVEPIVHGRGKINLRGTTWTVRGPSLSAGTAVRVVGRDGNNLVVEEASPEDMAETGQEKPTT